MRRAAVELAANGDTHSVDGGRSAPANAHEEIDEEEAGFWLEFRKRMISWRTMNRPLRLITGLGIAQLLAAGLFIALKQLLQLPGWSISMGVQGGREKVMPAPFFWAGLLFYIISLSFIMAGALRMRWPVRLLALIGLSWLTLYPPALPAYAVFRWVMLVALWLWAVLLALIEVYERPGREDDWLAPVIRRLHRARARGIASPLPLATLVYMLVWQIALLLPLLALSDWTRSSSDMIFQLSVEIQLEFLSFALTPALFLAGSDFAELGEQISAALTHLTTWPRLNRGRLAVWTPLGVTAAIALGILILNHPHYRDVSNDFVMYAGTLLMVGLVALALYGLLRWGRALDWKPASISGWALPLAALAYILLTWLGTNAALAATSSSAFTSTPAVAYSVFQAPAGAPSFNMLYPGDWKPSSTLRGSVQTGDVGMTVTFNGIGQQPSGFVIVSAITQAGANAPSAQKYLNDLLNAKQAGRLMSPGASGTDGPWRTQRFLFISTTGAGSALTGEGWSRAEDGYDWVMIAVNSAAAEGQVAPIYETMAHSWRLGAKAQTLPSSGDFSQTIIIRAAATYLGALPLALGLGLGVALIWLGLRRRNAMWGVTGIFAAAMGLYAGASQLPVMLAAIGASSPWFLYLDVPTLQTGVALATLGLVGWVALRRRDDARWTRLIRLAFSLNVGLLFIALMMALYTWAITLSSDKEAHLQPLTIAEGLIVVIALGWDLLMSGEGFTNRDDTRAPRVSRLLMYIGYITLTATLVMFFSSQHFAANAPPLAQGDSFTSFFESEPWPQRGLEFLGIPLLLTVSTIALLAWLRARRKGARGEGFVAAEERGYVVALDTTLTPELVAEGLVRDLTHGIQDARKKAGLAIEDSITLWLATDAEFAATLQRYAASIAEETLADPLTIAEGEDTAAPADAYREAIPANKLGGHAVMLALAKR